MPQNNSCTGGHICGREPHSCVRKDYMCAMTMCAMTRIDVCRDLKSPLHNEYLIIPGQAHILAANSPLQVCAMTMCAMTHIDMCNDSFVWQLIAPFIRVP